MANQGPIEIRIDVDAALADIRQQLGQFADRAPNVLRKAINDTAKRTGKELASLAQQRYTIKNKGFKKEIRYTYASKSNLGAVLSASGTTLPASDFKVSPSKPKPDKDGSVPARLSILKAAGMKTVQSQRGPLAFVAKFQSGHVAVVQREPPQTYTAGGWSQRKSRWGDYLQRTGKLDNTRIQEFYGPSVPMMLLKTGIDRGYIESMRPKIGEYLNEAVEKQIRKELYFANRGH